MEDRWGNTIEKKPKITTKRKCFICGKEVEMEKFQRYCGPGCKAAATRMDTIAHQIKFN
jgi:hypothetical protein|tara:strand:- start:806 stop:982 length:177 start_codon:yes stop_codon:yes gene_type:complete